MAEEHQSVLLAGRRNTDTLNRWRSFYQHVLTELATNEGDTIAHQRLLDFDTAATLLADIDGRTDKDVLAVLQAAGIKAVESRMATLMEGLSHSHQKQYLAVPLAIGAAPQTDRGCWHWQRGSQAVPVLAGLSQRQRLYCLSQMEEEGLLLRDSSRKNWRLPALSYLCFRLGFSPRQLLRQIIDIQAASHTTI